MIETWNNIRKELNLTPAEYAEIKVEEELIQALIEARQERNLTQKELARLCNVSQPFIARLETGNHSPQINSLLKVLVPLGYTLKIVPLESTLPHC